MSFKLPDLPYDFNALEPYIDAQTMEIHHGKHHNAYVTKLNEAIVGTDLENKTIEEILKSISSTSPVVRNNGGGHFNHSFFWQILAPNKDDNENLPSGKILEAIKDTFGSFDSFKEQFSQKAISRFGSGWAWLCVNTKDKNLCVCSTANQDNPLMDIDCCDSSKCCNSTEKSGCQPILGLDVWEHAYYLKYQNLRPKYIESFFKVINWQEVEKRYLQVINNSF